MASGAAELEVQLAPQPTWRLGRVSTLRPNSTNYKIASFATGPQWWHSLRIRQGNTRDVPKVYGDGLLFCKRRIICT